ncbi:divalent metal cation transporter [Patescibacteria group bacterium]|nr:divalent metal cation transporter [Patescibacteria group bacterium]
MPKIYQFLKNKFSRLGPGFITGAADNDPSGIATYSIAGAQFGYRLNWLCLFLTPMMVAIQEMCGRIGMCSGMGLAGVIKKFYSKKLLFFAVSLLLVANIVNIGADLGIMAASLKMILGLPFLFWLIVITILSISLEIFVSYKKYSFYLRFMGLTLLVYVLTAFIVKQDWLEVIKYTLIPHLSFNLAYLMILVGFIGTSISPYLFFWQASEEVEEGIENGKIKDFNHKPLVAKKEIRYLKRDTVIGMIFSNLIAMFIVLTTAATLHLSGITNLETPQQVALALKPLAGNFAFLLFTIGIIGIGLQAVPILAGGITYSLSEAFGFKEGLSKKLNQAKAFYLILALATLFGALLNFFGISPIKALYYAAIINGIISVPLIAMIIKMADDKRIIGNFKTTKLNRNIAWLTFIFVGVASVLMIFNFFFLKFRS